MLVSRRTNLLKLGNTPSLFRTPNVTQFSSNFLESKRFFSINKSNGFQISSPPISLVSPIISSSHCNIPKYYLFGPSQRKFSSQNESSVQHTVEQSSSPEIDASEVAIQALEAVEISNALRSHVQGSWLPWNILAEMMLDLHEQANIPWLGCFSLAVILIRLSLLPIGIKQQKIAQDSKIQTQEIKKKMKLVKSEDEKKELMNTMGTVAKDSAKRSLFVSLLSTPFFATLFMSIRQVILLDPSMKNSGILWFGDLTRVPSTDMGLISIVLFACTSMLSWKWTKSQVHPWFYPIGFGMACLFLFLTRTMTVGYQMIIQMSTLVTLIINYGFSRGWIRKKIGLIPHEDIENDISQENNKSNIVIPQLKIPIQPQPQQKKQRNVSEKSIKE